MKWISLTLSKPEWKLIYDLLERKDGIIEGQSEQRIYSLMIFIWNGALSRKKKT